MDTYFTYVLRKKVKLLIGMPNFMFIFRSRGLFTVTTLILASCSSNNGSNEDLPLSPLPDAPTIDQFFLPDAITQEEKKDFLNTDGVGYSYQSGLDSEKELVTLAGASNIDSIQPPTITGTARYTGTSNAVSVSRVDLLTGVLFPLLLPFALDDDTFLRDEHTANVVIDANLSDGSFSGLNTATLTDNTFEHSFTGEIRDGRLQGTGKVDYGQPQPIDSTLLGRIGDEYLVLVFKAQSTTTQISGGIAATR